MNFPKLNIAHTHKLEDFATISLLLPYLKTSQYSATDFNVLLVKAFRNLVSGKDEELMNAYAHFHKMVEQQQSVVRHITLAVVQQLERKTTTMNTDVSTLLATTKCTDRNTEDLVASVERMHECLEGKVLSGPILSFGRLR